MAKGSELCSSFWPLPCGLTRARAHLGLETQQQRNELAIGLTTPALLGLFSMVTLWAGQWAQEDTLPVRQAVWYRKPQPTFAEAIAVVSQHVGTSPHFSMSPTTADSVEIPRTLLARLTDTLCYAA